MFAHFSPFLTLTFEDNVYFGSNAVWGYMLTLVTHTGTLVMFADVQKGTRVGRMSRNELLEKRYILGVHRNLRNCKDAGVSREKLLDITTER